MAIWEKLFSKITFKDYPDTSTPLNASNMNALSDAIDGIDDRVVELNSNLNSRKILLNDTSKIPENAFLSNYQGMTTFGSTNGFVDVETLLSYIIPEGYRPNFPVRFPCYYSDTEGKPYLGAIYVEKTGSISVRYVQYYGTSAAAPTTGTVYFNASWISQ